MAEPSPLLFTCGGVMFTRLWLCFGTQRYFATEAEIDALLKVSRSNVLPINTHRLTPQIGWDGLELGYGGVTLRAFAERHDVTSMVRMLNINHATSSTEAVDRARLAVELTGERVIKLEVLQPELKTSNQRAVVEAAKALLAWRPDLTVLPLLAAEPAVAEELAGAGCPLLRVMGSPIGSGGGVTDEDALAAICRLGLPVILDGGVGSIEQVRRALDLGITGVLINSMMFQPGSAPVEVMRSFAGALESELRARAA